AALHGGNQVLSNGAHVLIPPLGLFGFGGEFGNCQLLHNAIPLACRYARASFFDASSAVTTRTASPRRVHTSFNTRTRSVWPIDVQRPQLRRLRNPGRRDQMCSELASSQSNRIASSILTIYMHYMYGFWQDPGIVANRAWG